MPNDKEKNENTKEQLESALNEIDFLNEKISNYEDPAEPIGYNMSNLLNDSGFSKNMRLDEHEQLMLSRKRQENDRANPYNAKDIATEVIRRSGIRDPWISQQLVECLAYGMNVKIKDPYMWQRSPRVVES